MKRYKQVSDAQELQMLNAEQQANSLYQNLRAICVEGTSDDLDRPIEVLLRDQELRTRYRLGSVNSVNIVRVLVQVTGLTTVAGVGLIE